MDLDGHGMMQHFTKKTACHLIGSARKKFRNVFTKLANRVC